MDWKFEYFQESQQRIGHKYVQNQNSFEIKKLDCVGEGHVFLILKVDWMYFTNDSAIPRFKLNLVLNRFI